MLRNSPEMGPPVRRKLPAVLSGPAAYLVVGLGLAIGVSRCYLGVHYPGDVLGGWALGIGAVAVAVLTAVGA